MTGESSLNQIKNLEGWESLELDGDAIQKIRDTQEKEGRELASLFHQAFVQNPAGQLVLDKMIKQTILKPVVTPAASQFEAGIREGRADLVRQILLNIELAESL